MRMNYSEHLCSVLAHALAERLALALHATGVEMEGVTPNYLIPYRPDDNEYAIFIMDKECAAQNFLENLDGSMKQAEITVGRTEEDSWVFVWEKAENILNFMDVLETIAAAPNNKKALQKVPYPGDEPFRETIKTNPALLYFASKAEGYPSLQSLFNDVHAESLKYEGGFFTFSLERLHTLAGREEYVSLPSERLDALRPKKA